MTNRKRYSMVGGILIFLTTLALGAMSVPLATAVAVLLGVYLVVAVAIAAN